MPPDHPFFEWLIVVFNPSDFRFHPASPKITKEGSVTVTCGALGAYSMGAQSLCSEMLDDMKPMGETCYKFTGKQRNILVKCSDSDKNW